MTADFEKLAYEAALRSLDKQEGLVGELRTRTNTFLAASSLAVSFLAQQALRGAGSGVLAVAALAAFVVSVAASVSVLLPKKELAFAGAGGRAYEGLYEERADMQTVYRQLTYELDALWVSNNLEIAALIWSNVLYS